jgi:hypothetical protein
LFHYTLVPMRFLPLAMGAALVLVAISAKRSLDAVQDAAA